MSARGAPVVLAVDVGGTSFKGALIDQAGRTRAEETIPLAGQTGEAAFARLQALCRYLQTVASAQALHPVAAGIITPGMDDVTGRVIYASNLGWRDLPLRDRMEQHLGLRVAAGHDVRSAGLAEGLLGAGRGVRDFALVMIGTGIAAALMSHGLIVAGARNMGGELGHVPITAGGEPCACGQSGCLETYASAAAIARRYLAQGGTVPLTAAAIAAARGHDPVARAVWADAVEALAFGLTTLTMLMDPALFILGGGLVEAGAGLIDPLAAALDRRLAWRSAPPIRRSMLGLAAGRMGAAILAFRLAGEAEVVEEWPVGRSIEQNH